MQRERARERIDRARRQWELEHGRCINNTTIITFVKITTNTTTIIIIDRAQRQCSSNMVGIVIINIYNVIIIIYL